MAYSDTLFRVVRACPLSLNLEIMEALAPNLCVQKSSIAHYNFSVTANTTSLVFFFYFFLPQAPSVSMFTLLNCCPHFPR